MGGSETLVVGGVLSFDFIDEYAVGGLGTDERSDSGPDLLGPGQVTMASSKLFAEMASVNALGRIYFK